MGAVKETFCSHFLMYQVTTLKSGLKVISKELKTIKTVLLRINLKAGSKFVPQGKEGLAHLLEHMVMKGSKRYPSSLTVLRTIEELGGTINGRTGPENATYFVKVIAEDLEKAAEVLFPLVITPLLNKGEFPGEKKIVLEEVARYEDRIENLVSDNFYISVFGKHPLGKRVLGYRETVENLSTGDVTNFFNTYYLPKNIVISAAGNVDHDQLVGLVQKWFRASAKGRDLPKYKKFEPGQEGPRATILRRGANQAHLMLGFLIPPRSLTEYIRARFVCRLLQSKDRLFAKLREREKLAYGVDASYFTYQDGSILLISGGFSHNRVAEAVKALAGELQALKEKLVAKNELAKIRKLIEVGLLFAFETPGGWVNFALFGNDLLGHAIEPEEYLREVSKVTADDIQRFAQEIFVSERAYLSTVHENINTEDLEKLIRDGLRT